MFLLRVDRLTKSAWRNPKLLTASLRYLNLKHIPDAARSNKDRVMCGGRDWGWVANDYDCVFLNFNFETRNRVQVQEGVHQASKFNSRTWRWRRCCYKKEECSSYFTKLNLSSSYFIRLHLSSKDHIRSEGASTRIESKNSSQSVACSPVMKSFLALALVVLVAHNIVNIVRAGDADPLQDVCVADTKSGGM